MVKSIKNLAGFSLIFLLMIVFFSGCSETKLQRVIVRSKPAFNIERFDSIYIAGFKINTKIDNTVVNREILKTLKEELLIYYKKSVKVGERINVRNDKIFDDQFFWREYVKEENSIIITGKININKETRSRIKTVRSTPLSLKSKNILQSLKFLNSEIIFYVYSGETGKRVYQYKFNYKITDDSGEADSVLVSRLISIGVDRFINRIIPREHIVYRYFFNY